MIQRSVKPLDCDRLEIAKPRLEVTVSHFGCIAPRLPECRDDPSVTRYGTHAAASPIVRAVSASITSSVIPLAARRLAIICGPTSNKPA
jgi:hypothetical protein